MPENHPAPEQLAAWRAADERLNAAYDRFDEVLGRAWQLNGTLAGQKYPSRRHQLAYIALSQNVVTGTNLLRLTHKISDEKAQFFLDEASVFPICRRMLENLAVFYYLAGEDVADAEADHRWAVFSVHDAARRVDLLRQLMDATPEEAGEKELERRRGELKLDPLFKGLPPERQVKLLDGMKTPFRLEAIVEKAGLERRKFEAAYRLFSEYTHAGPVSFTRFEEDRRRGEGWAHQRRNIAFGLEVAAAVLSTVDHSYRRICPAAAKEFDEAGDQLPRPFWRP